jgi:organic radical activating enzyme
MLRKFHNLGARARNKARRILEGDMVRIRSLEINVTAHCNLKCYGCGRGSPAMPEEFLSLDELKADLRPLSRVLKAGEFKLAGGEPLIHPELLEIIDAIRASRITDRITLITNGVQLHTFGDELWDRIDEIWISNYPGVRGRVSQDEVFERGQKHNVHIEYNLMRTFTQRLLNNPNNDESLVRDIYDRCYQRIGCHSMYNGRLFQCATGPFVPKWLEQVGREPEDFSGDGVDIHGDPDLKQTIRSYLARNEPLGACRYCLAGLGNTFANHQVNKQGVGEWLAEAHLNPRELIDEQRMAESPPISDQDNYEAYGRRIDLDG